MKTMRRDRRAIAGPFEDIPALLLITVGVVILMVSITNALYTYEQNARKSPEDMLDDLVYALRSYDKITESGRGPGVFSSLKLGAMDAKAIAQDLGITYDFKVEVRESSSYGSAQLYRAETGPVPDVGDAKLVFRSVPAGLVCNSEVHAAVLTVAIWGYE
jgi:hypothetical protein